MILSIDIGGTAVKMGLVDESGAIHARHEASVCYDNYETPILTTVIREAKVLIGDMMENNPEKAMMLAIKGMLPHNTLGRQMIKKLRVYAGSEHDNAAQKPEVWEVK